MEIEPLTIPTHVVAEYRIFGSFLLRNIAFLADSLSCVSWIFRYVPKNKYASFFINSLPAMVLREGPLSN